jgi:hypothetical protein
MFFGTSTLLNLTQQYASKTILRIPLLGHWFLSAYFREDVLEATQKIKGLKLPLQRTGSQKTRQWKWRGFNWGGFSKSLLFVTCGNDVFKKRAMFCTSLSLYTLHFLHFFVTSHFLHFFVTLHFTRFTLLCHFTLYTFYTSLSPYTLHF